MIIYIKEDNVCSLYNSEEFPIIAYENKSIIAIDRRGEINYIINIISEDLGMRIIDHIGYCMGFNKNYIRIIIREHDLESIDYDGIHMGK